ncbi:hypothetical protein SAMN04489797_2427 [Winogradskyella sediminis]|uniref:Uncharacterized protein n=1 Tax=Winogradskyella sediminis TaxID=1382466 RepID=A0A1H1V257_9FLAO|nr:hypothetical protein SAMN04489797_2427 [Winogradskyella sediminis]
MHSKVFLFGLIFKNYATSFLFRRYFKAPEGHLLIWLIMTSVCAPSRSIHGITELLNTFDNCLAQKPALVQHRGV